jgi:signal transduction histidine kinase
MKKPFTVLMVAVVLMVAAGVTSAAEFGTREQAKAMLERAIAVLKADKERALDLFTSGDGGFIDRDLYVFCGGPDGMLTAHPYFMGINLKAFKDKTGMAVGEEVYASAKEGEVSEISYKWLQPGGGDEQVDKVSFYTKVADQVCGVGFYPQ